jgi:hypothetical protein
MEIESNDPVVVRKALGAFGTVVGPRTGPNRRTKSQKEEWCLRRYLLSAARHLSLHWPIRIEKHESPDFLLTESGGRVTGIEVTEATYTSHQKWLTTTEALPGTVLLPDEGVGDAPERRCFAAITYSVIEKNTRIASYQRAFPCDILIYASPPEFYFDKAIVVDMLLAHRFEHTKSVGCCSVILGDLVLHDFVRTPRVLPLVE